MRVVPVIFSTTGGTERVARVISSALGEGEAVDITVKPAEVVFGAEDVCVIAVPSFGGRVPAVAAERIGALKGNGARAVLVCVYGNRAYEDTLVELEDVVRGAGFVPVAAIAAVAEHSIARKIAAGRPDAEDVRLLKTYAEEIMKKLERGETGVKALPGNRPYKKMGGAGLVPKPTKACVGCNVCADNCPVGAIERGKVGKVKKKACISCMRCVAVCPHGARKGNAAMVGLVSTALSAMCAKPKPYQCFL